MKETTTNIGPKDNPAKIQACSLTLHHHSRWQTVTPNHNYLFWLQCGWTVLILVSSTVHRVTAQHDTGVFPTLVPPL
jgi:hypothetical protein